MYYNTIMVHQIGKKHSGREGVNEYTNFSTRLAGLPSSAPKDTVVQIAQGITKSVCKLVSGRTHDQKQQEWLSEVLQFLHRELQRFHIKMESIPGMQDFVAQVNAWDQTVISVDDEK